MKKYFISTDIHSYFSIFLNQLNKQHFDKNNPEHYVIICGDLFDRGQEAKELLKWVTEFNKTGRLILIRGNHEDLMLDCLRELKEGRHISPHHISNGTLNTISQITGINEFDLQLGIYDYKKIHNKMKPLLKIIDSMLNYYELGNYIFVHGWVPYTLQDSHDPDQQEGEFSCIMIPEIDLNAEDFMWAHARWSNGMKEWHMGVTIPNKTIVCGHWHCSHGNYLYHKLGSGEFEKDSSFEPFIDEGVICLDACTAFTQKVNLIVLDELGNILYNGKNK